MDKKTVKRGLLPYVLLALIMLGMFYFFGIANQDVTVLTYNEFIEEMNNGKITELEVVTRVSGYTYEATGKLKGYEDNEYFFAKLPLSDEVMKKIINASEEYKFKLVAEADPDASSIWIIVLEILPIVLIVGAGFWILSRQMAGNKSSMDFGKRRARLNSDQNKVTFKDVAGLKDEKE